MLDRPHAGELVRYDAMCRAIDAAYEVDEAKHIRDQAIALETYARQARNTEAERKACEIRLRAERKAGQLLAKTEKAKGAPGNQHTGPVKSPDRSKSSGPSTLRDLGVSKQQSSDWQKLAAVPEQDFEAALADKTEMPTTAGIIRQNAKPKVNPVSEEAGCDRSNPRHPPHRRHAARRAPERHRPSRARRSHPHARQACRGRHHRDRSAAH
jgi:hypothetical protein